MVTKTTNLKLNKPEGTDVIDISVLNANMDILDEAVPSKVDKVAGKQLSTEDYTTAEKTKLGGIADGAQVNVIEGVTVNGSAVPVTGKTANVAVPTKVSDLANDADYAKVSQIPTKVSTLQNDAGYAKTADVPKDTKDLTNSAGFITKAVADLANYYVKTDTYTRSEVLELVNAIPKFTVTVVDSLPASGDQATIYFIPVEGKGLNVHDEYIWVNGAWEQIGSTAFELDITQDASGIKINGTALQGASATQDGLLTKGAYATFAGKQDAGDYATTDALTKGLAKKQDTGDYALRSEIPDISEKADKSEIPDISGKLDKSGGTMTGPLNINGGDGQGINIPQDGTINGPGTATLFGFLSNVFTVGSGTWPTNIRGQGARPKYNNADLAMLSDVPSIAGLATEAYVNSKVSSVYRVMGSCTTAQLASKAKTKGDVWNLTDAGQYGPIGTNVVYTGMEWDALAGTFDPSGLATKGEVQTAQSKADSAYNLANGKADASALAGYVPTSRTINNKALTSNISLGASDVGALPSNGKANTAGTADKATNDGSNRNIVNTYATKMELNGKLDVDKLGYELDSAYMSVDPLFYIDYVNALRLSTSTNSAHSNYDVAEIIKKDGTVQFRLAGQSFTALTKEFFQKMDAMEIGDMIHMNCFLARRGSNSQRIANCLFRYDTKYVRKDGKPYMVLSSITGSATKTDYSTEGYLIQRPVMLKEIGSMEAYVGGEYYILNY